MFSAAILKLNAYCNLNCTYCYMFNLEDRTYASVPKSLTIQTALLFLDKLEEYLTTNKITRFQIILHGGEPSLWSVANFHSFLNRVDYLNKNGFAISLSMQTNLFKIDWSLIELLAVHNVAFGISIDGPRQFNDLFRVTHNQKGSYDLVMRNVQALLDRGFGQLIAGFLCVANPAIEPALFLQWIYELPVKSIDVLWPMEFNYNKPPWQTTTRAHYAANPTYGKWFLALFKEWLKADDSDIYIRFFHETILRLSGQPTTTDVLGNESFPVFTVNTDGAFEYNDYFRAHAHGSTRTPYTVFEHTINDLLHDPLFQYALHLHDHLPAPCASCAYQTVCGGGFLPGRFSGNDRFPTRKSVLCYDEYHFFSGVAACLQAYNWPVTAA